MPPVTPSRTRSPPASATSALVRRDRQQPLVDLAKRDRQRLVVLAVGHERADELQQPLLELGVVGVDLAGTLGAVDDEGVLGVRSLEQLVDRRVGDALGLGNGSGHGYLTWFGSVVAPGPGRTPTVKSTRSAVP